MRAFKKGLTVVCALILAGCSTNFLYNQLNWLVPWYVADYVDFSPSQRLLFKQDVGDFLDWHRSEELSSYLHILDEIEQELDGSLTAATFARWENEIEDATERAQDRAMTVALKLGEKLSERQIEDIFALLEEDQQELKEDYLERNDEDFREMVQEELEDGLDYAIGGLTATQKLQLKQSVGLLIRFDEIWLAQRQHFLVQAREVLRREPGWQQRAREMLTDSKALELPEFTAVNDYNREIIYTVMADILNQRTQRQDRKLRRLIQSWRRDIQKIAGQPV